MDIDTFGTICTCWKVLAFLSRVEEGTLISRFGALREIPTLDQLLLLTIIRLLFISRPFDINLFRLFCVKSSLSSLTLRITREEFGALIRHGHLISYLVQFLIEIFRLLFLLFLRRTLIILSLSPFFNLDGFDSLLLLDFLPQRLHRFLILFLFLLIRNDCIQRQIEVFNMLLIRLGKHFLLIGLNLSFPLDGLLSLLKFGCEIVDQVVDQLLSLVFRVQSCSEGLLHRLGIAILEDCYVENPAKNKRNDDLLCDDACILNVDDVPQSLLNTTFELLNLNVC